MAGISNSRHTILTDVPRVLFTGTKRIAVVADTTSFSSTAGVPTPSAITLTANLFGISGTINWTVPYGTATLSSSTGASVTLAFGNMVSKVVTVRASITVVGVTYTSDITLTKTEDGVSGADSKYVVVNTTGYVFTREDEYNAYAPSAISLSFTAFGGTASTYVWEYWTGAGWSYITGAATLNILNSDGFTGSRTYRITATIGGTDVYDQVTLTKLTGGTDAFAGYLTNESITFATDSSGTTPPNIATLTAGTFKVFWGAVDVTSGCTFSKTDSNCTTSITNGTGAYSASAVTSDSATSTFTATHTATGTTVTKILSLAKSRVGVNGTRTAVMDVYQWAASAPSSFPVGSSVYTWATGQFTAPSNLNGWSLTPTAPVLGQTLWACSVKYVDSLTTTTSTITWDTAAAYPIGASGVNAKSLALTADTQVFQVAKTGLVNGVAAGSAAVTFTSVSQNLTGSPPLAFNVISGAGSLSGTGNTRTLFYSSMGASDTVVVEVTGDGLSDKMTVVKVREGSDALVGYLTNDSANLPASDAGVVSSYSAAVGTFEVWRGGTNVTTSCTFSVITNVDGLTTSIGASTGVYSVTAGFPNGNNTTSVTYRAVYTYAGQTYTIDKIFSLSKAKTGAIGITGAEVDIVFLRSTTQPATPTSTFNPPTVPDTWYSNVNSVPASANPMWSSVGKLPAGSSTWTWQVPIQVEGTDGADGSDANVVSEIYVYRESFSAPLTPTGGTYSFATNTFTTLPTDWVGSMPVVGTLPIYQSAAVASAPTGGSDSTLTWSSPVKIYENADDGIDAKLMSLSVNSQVFQVNKAGVATPSSISIKAIRNNITGATFSVIDGTATLTSVSGDNATLLYTNMSSDSVTIRVRDATTTYEDTITIVKVREGSDALVGYLTNENVTLPAQTDGTVVSYTGASGKFIVLRGATDVTDQCTFEVLANPNSLTPTNNIVTAGTNAGDYMITGGFTTDVASVTYRATYVFNSLTYYVSKIFTLSKSKTGTTGAEGSAGSSARIAYVKTTTDLSPTPSTYTWTGDVLPQLDNPSPTTGRWGEVNAWLTYPPTIGVGEQVWQSTGVYNYLTNQTTWVSPYLSNLKVGNLSAITVNTGTLTVDASGYVRGGQTGYNTGTGFWLGYDGGAYKFSIGTSSEGITWNGSVLSIKGNLQVGNAVRSTTTMTGSGAEIKSDGGFAMGNSAGNINYDTTKMTMNGDWWSGGDWRLKQSTNNYLRIGNALGGATLNIVRADNNGAPALIIADTNTSGLSSASISNTSAGAAIEVSNTNASGYAIDYTGRLRIFGASSPIILQAAQGAAGQTLISQGNGNTPAWGKKMFSGAQAADGSGNLTVTVDFPDTSYAPVATSTSGVYVVITAKSTTSITFQAQDRATGAGVSGAGISWIAMG